MFRTLRPVAWVSAASIAVGVLAGPGAAQAADTTTQVSAAVMAAELKAVSRTSTSAARSGWKATVSLTMSDLSATGRYVVDPVGGVASEYLRVGTVLVTNYAVAGKGMYEYTNDPTKLAAVRMMGRPSVRYVFTSKPVQLDAYVEENAPSPAVVLAEDGGQPGTKTTHDDGSVDYKLKDEDGVTATLHVDAAGVLTSVRGRDTDFSMTLTYAYGAQHVTLPAASVTVDSKALSTAVAYLSMPASVRTVANQGAAHTRRAANGHKVQLTSLRTIVRRDATAFNSATRVTMIKVGDISGGARVSATNPWTRATVSYTVKASGNRVLLARG